MTVTYGDVPLLDESGRFPDSFAPPSVAADKAAAAQSAIDAAAAKGLAESARDTAAGSAQTATTKAGDAETARAAAVTAQGGAEAARDAAESAAAIVGPWAAPRAGQALAAMLDMEIGDPVVTILGDSTGTDWFAWPRQWVNGLIAGRPGLTCRFGQWADATKSYTWTTLQDADTTSTIVADSFNRVAADVIGTTGETGGAWKGTTGRFSLDGKKLVVNSAGLAHAYGTGSPASMSTTATLTLDLTAGAADARTVEIGTKAVSAVSHLFVSMSVPAAGGGLVWSVWQRINDTETKLADGEPFAGTGATAITATIALDGNAVSASVTIGATTKTAARTITSGTQATLAAGNGYTIWAKNTAVVGTTVDSIVGVAGTQAPVLTVYNGSMPGSTLAYQTTNFGAMVPVAPTVTILNSGHNYNGGTPADYLAAVRNFVTLLRGSYPDADIVTSGQNPEFTAGGRSQAHVTAHARRLTSLRGDAYRQGWGYIPTHETFHALPGGGEAWVNADGVHPLYDATGVHDGNQVWAALVAAYFDAMRVL